MSRIGYVETNMTLGTYDASEDVVFLYNLPTGRTPTRDDILAAIHDDDRAYVGETMRSVIQNPRNFNMKYRVKGADGEYRTVKVTASVSVDSDQQVHAFGTVQDVTEIERAQAYARFNEERLRDFAEAASDWFWETDDNHRLTFVSRRFQTLTGISIDKLIGRSRMEYGDRPETDAEWSKHRADLEAKRPFNEFKFWMKAPKNGEGRLMCISGVPVFDRLGHFTGYRGVGHDGTDQHKIIQKLKFLANRDKLTGLLNRHAFEAEAKKLGRKKNQSNLVLLLLNLVRFKYVNDNFGQHRGDSLLAAVSQRLANWLPADALLSRLAGDEFAILLPAQEQIENVGIIARAIIEKIVEPYELDGLVVTINACIGSTKQYGSDIDRALLEADVALNAAKRRGNNFEFFDNKMKLAADRRKSLERKLRLALSNDEFHLVYQPQIDLKSGQLSGAEALLRWRTKQGDDISPFEFIPLAEDIGLMPEIGRWVMDEAIRQQKQWQRAGLNDLTMAINVSATQFIRDDVAANLRESLALHKVAASSIELEITESVFMRDQDLVAKAIAKIRELGAKMALDDFGTGYSSLSYLRNFPVDCLKIDRSFIDPIVDDKSALAIVAGIVQLAHSLDLEVVAEGVELIEHVNVLRKLNCQTAQGYYFAKPLPASELLSFAPKKAACVA